MKWLDAPIGSGRLMDNIEHPIENCFGLDLSSGFIKYNQSKGIDCFQSDLFNLNLNKKFDFLTGLHTIFAFVNFKEILTNYLKLLNKEDTTIDVVNLHMYDDFYG